MPDDVDIAIILKIRDLVKSLVSHEALILLAGILDDERRVRGEHMSEPEAEAEAMQQAANLNELLKSQKASELQGPESAVLAALGLDLKGADSFTSRQISSELSGARARLANVSTVMDSLKQKAWVVAVDVPFGKHKLYRLTDEGRATALRLRQQLADAAA